MSQHTIKIHNCNNIVSGELSVCGYVVLGSICDALEFIQDEKPQSIF